MTHRPQRASHHGIRNAIVWPGSHHDIVNRNDPDEVVGVVEHGESAHLVTAHDGQGVSDGVIRSAGPDLGVHYVSGLHLGGARFAAEPHPGSPAAYQGHHGPSVEPLRIHFVLVGPGGALNGTIDPYPGPECKCILSTTFVGDLVGDRIHGTYTTRGGLAQGVTQGKWEAWRESEGGS